VCCFDVFHRWCITCSCLMFARAWVYDLNKPFLIFKCRQQPVLVSHHLCDSDIHSWLSLNEDPHLYRLQTWRLQYWTRRQGEGARRITLLVWFYHISVFSSTFHNILKMSKNSLHNSVHFRRTETPAVCPKLTTATLTKLTNDVDVIFYLEPGKVCCNMLVKHVKPFYR